MPMMDRFMDWKIKSMSTEEKLRMMEKMMPKMLEGMSSDDIIQKVLETIPVP